MTVSDSARATGLPLDERGLIELTHARERVAKSSDFRKGRGRFVGGNYQLDSDLLWACLMSLESTEEFVREATRLAWYFHPRAHQNLEPLERYGVGIFFWLSSFKRGAVLVNVPWCVLPCLNALATREAWELLYSVNHVLQDERSGPGPFAVDSAGDVDLVELGLNDKAPIDRSDQAARALLAFAEANPEVALPWLVVRAAEKDAAAKSLLRMLMASLGPSASFAIAAEALGEESATAHFETLGLPTALTDAMILNVLDYSARSSDGWPPLFQAHAERAYHGLRLVAFRERSGDGWVVLFERLESSALDSIVLRRFAVSLAFGCGELPAQAKLELFFDEVDPDTLVGPAGEISVARDDVRDTTALVRAYLAEFPGAFWTDPEELIHLLGLDGYDIIADSDAFEHVVGSDSANVDEARVQAHWRVLPSQSAVYRSLSRAIAASDPGLFQPGPSNL